MAWWAWLGATLTGKTPESRRSLFLDNRLVQQHAQDQDGVRLLLLGAPEAGKATLLKQLRQSFGAPYRPEERQAFTAAIHAHTLLCMRALLARAELASPRAPAPAPAPAAKAASTVIPQTPQQLEQHKLAVMSHPVGAPLTEAVARAVHALWASGDEGLMLAFAQRRRFNLADTAPYYFERALAFAAPKFLPSDEDILRVRCRPKGVVEAEFKIELTRVRVIDVGGQHNEREKWVRLFEGVTAVVFVVSLSEFDQALVEDPSRNRLVEALGLFHWVVNHPAFVRTAFVLLLNKKDLFAEQLKVSELRHAGGSSQTERFLDYLPAKPQTYESALEYLRGRFVALVPESEAAIAKGAAAGPHPAGTKHMNAPASVDRLRVHVISALDKKAEMQRVLKDIVSFVTDEGLKEALNPSVAEEDD